MGRDHYVKVVYKGYLFPMGHRASLVKVTERKFMPMAAAAGLGIALPDVPFVAYLKQHMYIVVQQHEREYSPEGRVTLTEFGIDQLIVATLIPELVTSVPNVMGTTGACAVELTE